MRRSETEIGENSGGQVDIYKGVFRRLMSFWKWRSRDYGTKKEIV